ncbi:MAG TPA: CBS domain-containing protein [Streptosporangiaceae bacterium]|jgi:CBS domain-containing protein
MNQKVADVMTPDPVTIEREQSVAEAAQLMANDDIGDIIVLDNGTVTGILTDRDIVIRLVAAGKDAGSKISDIVSESELITVSPDTAIEQAVGLMRQHSVRRLPVLRKGRAVGVISLGDLAIERDDTSALADISAALGNN